MPCAILEAYSNEYQDQLQTGAPMTGERIDWQTAPFSPSDCHYLIKETIMTTNEYTREEMVSVLNGVAVDKTDWQSLEGGNQKFWTVPENFRLGDYAVENNSLTRFDDWGTDEKGNKIVRLWSKW